MVWRAEFFVDSTQIARPTNIIVIITASVLCKNLTFVGYFCMIAATSLSPPVAAAGGTEEIRVPLLYPSSRKAQGIPDRSVDVRLYYCAGHGLTFEQFKDALGRAVVGTWDSVRVGQGRFGEVRRIHTEGSSIQQRLVFKVNKQCSDRNYRNVLAEAWRHVGMQHPHIVSCLGLANAEEIKRAYLLMPEMQCTVYSLIASQGGTIPLSHCLAIIRQVAAGLDYLHSKQKVIHRDLNTTNVLLDDRGFAMISDFGHTIAIDSPNPNVPKDQSEHSHVFRGAVVKRVLAHADLHAAPEQYTGRRVQPGIDNYSLGLLLICLLEKRPINVAWTNHPRCSFTGCLNGCPHFTWPAREGYPLRHYIDTLSLSKLTHQRPSDRRCLLARVLTVVIQCLQEDPRERMQEAKTAETMIGDIEKSLQRLSRETDNGSFLMATPERCVQPKETLHFSPELR